MFATLGEGINVSLNKEDKARGLEKGILKCKFNNDENCPRFYLHIVNEVFEQTSLEVPGIHVRAYPMNRPIEQRRR